MARPLTDESKDVPDGGDEDDQGVGAGQQYHGDDNVADPAEVLGGAQEVVDRGADLQGGSRRRVSNKVLVMVRKKNIYKLQKKKRN